MMSKKIYEDVLDSLDRIEPDVPEEDRYPIFRDGYAFTVMIGGLRSINKDAGRNIMPDVLRVYLDKYSDDYRMTQISSEEDMSEFTEETGIDSIDDDDRPCTVVQFNASKRNALRLIFWIFSVGMYFMRLIHSGNKWKPHTQVDVFSVYELVRGTHRKIKDRDLNYIVTYIVEFGRDEGDTARLPDLETYDYVKKIVGTYSEMFGKRQTWT